MFLQVVTQKVRNVVRGIAQRYGSADLKRRMWDREFASGRWDCLENMAQDCLYPYVEKYADGGSILDLGCGPGATGNELDAEKYRFYTGVDISEVAVEKGRRRSAFTNRTVQNEYIASDISTFVPTRHYDVIVFGDSIYYVPEKNMAPMLHRYANFLTPGGVFIVRIRGERPSIPASIEREFALVEKGTYFDGDIQVLVFQPRTEAN